jgi:amino acid transporter
VAAILGVVESLAIAAVLTLVEVVGLMIVVGAGFSGPAVELPAMGVPLSGLAAASLLAFFAFIGFEDMVNMAEETRDPGRTMPRAIIAALALTTLLYVLVAWAATRTVPGAELAASERPLALVFERATGQGAAFLVLIAVAAALNGVLAQMVMSARVLYGLGRFWAPFRVFHHAHPRFGTPVLATCVAVGLVVILGLTAPLVALAEVTSIVLLVVFCAVNLALIGLRRQGAGEGFSVPIIVPWIGLILSAGALVWGIAS